MALLNNRRRLGTILMGVGLLLVAGAGLSYAWEGIQADLLQARLRSLLPPERPALAAVATGEPGSLTASARTVITAAPAQATAGAAAAPEAVTATAIAQSAMPAGQVVGTPPAASPSPSSITTQPATTTPMPAPTPIPASPPVRIVIPDLGIDIPVQEMTWIEVKTATGTESQWQIPEYAGGHAVNSALLGQRGNVVISGHNNIYGRVFMPISQAWGGQTQVIDKATERSTLLDGRLVQIYAADGRRFDYYITDFIRVHDFNVPLSQRLANGQYIQQTDDARLTITTCWPPWGNTYRLIVIAKPAG
jgi:hypothetical protein